MHALNSLLPVILLLCLGKALTRAPVFSDNLPRDLTRLTYWVALPALLLDKVTHTAFSPSEVSTLTLLMVLATLIAGATAYPAAKVLKIEREALGAFVQGTVRGNNAFVRLPVIFYALGDLHPEAGTVAIVALAPAVIIYNILSVTILLAHSNRQKVSPAEAARLYAKQLLCNPLLTAAVAALAMKAAGLQFPHALQRSVSAMGTMAPGMALISIGASLSFKGIRNGLARSLTAASIQVFVQPLIGLALALLWNLTPVNHQILLIYLACPTGTASYILADIFGSDKELAAHIIVISTLLSAVSLSLVLAFYGG